jgi:ribosomal protein S1
MSTPEGPHLLPLEGIAPVPREGDSLRSLVDLAIRAVDVPRGLAPMPPAAVWDAVARAREVGDPVAGRIVLTLEAGAFVYLGGDVYGFAARRDLPLWVPRWPGRGTVGRQLEGIVTGIDEEAGAVFISPRLAALRTARERVGGARRVNGRVVSASVSGLVLDLGGARGFAARRELELDWLLAGPQSGSRWRGYVVEMGDAVVRLSVFPPGTRARRASRRERALAAIESGMPLSGRVVAAGSGGALVALGDGLVTGLVPAPAMRSPLGTRVVPDAELMFRVVGRPSDPGDQEVDVHLWPRL